MPAAARSDAVIAGRSDKVVAGVDGCRSGWVVALATVGSATITDVVVVPTFAAVLRLRAVARAVDMPIGLSDRGPRACDVAARTRLGPRRSSVFPAPCRPVLGALTYEDACAIGRRVDGRALSRQAFNLLPKIAEVDAEMSRGRQRRTVEAHPELAFAACLGRPAALAKRTAGGRDERIRALRSAGAGPLIERRVAGAAGDDVLDACALTLVARRLATGSAERLGDGSRDATGLRMEIVI